MNSLYLFRLFRQIACFAGCTLTVCYAQTPPQLSRIQPTPAREIGLTLSGQSGAYYQIDAATNLASWNALATLASGTLSSLQYTDSAAPFLQSRFYRVQ